MAGFSEDDLIGELAARVKYTPDLLLGIGDDAAVIETEGIRLLSTDLLVEGVHFDLNYATPFQVGWKAAAANLSDIAAMGGDPLYLLVGLAAPKGKIKSFWKPFNSGLRELADRYRVSLIGGDLSRSPGPIFISVTIIGKAGNIVKREGASPGDLIWVSGYLGEAAAGLELLRQGKSGPPKWQPLIERQLTPIPRLETGKILAAEKLAASMMDLSDGIGCDLPRLTKAFGLGARIHEDKLPLSDSLIQAAAVLKKSPLDFALYGGEDYELIWTSPPQATKKIRRLISHQPAVIGEITSSDQLLLIAPDGKETPLLPGFDHFNV